MNILVLVESFTPQARQLLEAAGHTVDERSHEGSYESDAEGAIVRLGIPVNEAFFARMPNLRVLGTATTGLNHIDLDAARARDVEVVSLKDDIEFLNTITSTAELAFGLLIDLMRRTPWAFDSVRRGEFLLEEFRGRSLFDKTLGIVGMGRLGKIVAAGAEGWRMRVHYTDPHVPQSAVPRYSKMGLHDLLSTSDAVSLHLHLSDETKLLIDGPAIARMKRGAYLVNTSRGEIVDESAVIEALERGHLAGYATDVVTNEAKVLEKGTRESPLIAYAKSRDNCIVVPHTGGLTQESRERTDVRIAQKLLGAIRS
jgi:D-3-phosphoglycerate dehydrogenase / 2-oxoglutarate reductase